MALSNAESTMQANLQEPLKRQTLKDRLERYKPSLLQVASGVLGVAVVVGGIWLYWAGDPFAGEPVAVLKIPPLEKLATATTPKNQNAVPNPKRGVSPEADPEDLAADRAEIKRQRVAIIQRPGRVTVKPLRRAPVLAVAERGPFGTLPKIARNGRTPFEVYSTKLSKTVLRSNLPKIAIVIGGMGINVKNTNSAIKELPAPVTFAFAPYGRGLQSLINKSRRRGHEVLLHIPMEPFGYPGVNPGPKTLIAKAEPIENLKKLKWLMGRFTGYSGVTNYMGAKFSADGGALLPVFSQIKSRGLVYFDDGSSSGTLSTSISQAVKLSSRTADVILDNEGNFATIRRSLSSLEAIARKKGFAIGSGTGLSTTIDAVESWSRELEDRGFLLVPLSAVYRAKRS